ncbi:unnamed protein product [Closterium sp. NIES-65]|nr:unnamed protein product [Closterium sp. NIES-65]
MAHFALTEGISSPSLTGAPRAPLSPNGNDARLTAGAGGAHGDGGGSQGGGGGGQQRGRAAAGAVGSGRAQQEAGGRVNTALRLQAVEGASEQVVAGTLHRIRLTAHLPSTTAPATAQYEAVVWEKPWEGFRELQSFDKIDAP